MPWQHAKLANVLDHDSDKNSEDADAECASSGNELAAETTFSKCNVKQQLCSGCSLNGKCCSGCLFCALALLVILVVIILNINSWLAAAIETVGGALLGVDISVGAVEAGLIEGRASISELSVGSPVGFQGSFLDLGSTVFDIGVASVLAVAASEDKPLDLQELSVQNLNVNLEQPTRETSNVQALVQHMNTMTKAIAPKAKARSLNQESVHEALTVMTTKIRVGKIEFSNITVVACMQPLCGIAGPVSFTLREILVKDVGRKGNGVHLYELIEIFVTAIIRSVIKAAPEQLQLNMLTAIGNALDKCVDYQSLNIDKSGHGLEEVGNWGWRNAFATPDLHEDLAGQPGIPEVDMTSGVFKGSWGWSGDATSHLTFG
mmetsp:Transcript_68764/g.152145  ORF Transcript_68764/g.152145 Transcript_68764/m.152145 type:complete len:376 (-) Transcript_68764:93-1220(-)